MLKIGGKDVIFSRSFLMAQGEDVVLTVPEILARSIKISATRKASEIVHNDQAVKLQETDTQVAVDVPFTDAGIFSFEIGGTQLVTKKGLVKCRIAGSAHGGKYMLIHLDLHEGRFDNYVGE